MTKGIVIARFNEDLKWLEDFTDFNMHIYNKGNNIDLKNVILPNIGREAHTYLTHIVNNYDNLDDFTVFCQGNPNDHSNSKNFINCQDYVGYKTYVNYWANLVDGEVISRKHIPGSLWMNFKSRSQITPTVIYNMVFNGKKIPEDCWVPVCAQFSVNKESILKHKKEVYIDLLNLFNRQDSNWMAYVLEYCWTLIFSDVLYKIEDTGGSIV